MKPMGTRPESRRRRLYSIDEAAQYLGRSTVALREMIYAGKLPMVKVDRRVQIDIDDLDRLIESSKTTYTQ